MPLAIVSTTTMMAELLAHLITIMIAMQLVTVLSTMVQAGGSIPVWLPI